MLRVKRKPNTGDLNDIIIKCGADTLSNGDTIDVQFKGSWAGKSRKVIDTKAEDNVWDENGVWDMIIDNNCNM